MGLFLKKIEPRCQYCTLGRTAEADSILCPKKGVMSPGSSCRSFRYDPMKRVPPRPVAANFSALKDEDFQL